MTNGKNSRDAILAAIRARPLPPVPLPGRFEGGIRYDDPLRQFGEALTAVGGVLISASDPAEANQRLLALPHLAAATTICSLVAGIGTSTLSLDAVADPHELESVDVAVLPGEFAVAENAAIWFAGHHVKHRVLPFITQHLVLVVPVREIVHNLHEAYDRLRFARAEFGVFISGPSKTADIEQSLVIGAHGPRSLTVVLLATPRA